MGKIQYGREVWLRLCEFVSSDDELPVIKTKGIWTAKKLYFFCQYLDQVARAMHSHPSYPQGLTYVNLFAGNGIAVVDDERTGATRRFPGSGLIAGGTTHPYHRLILVDSVRENLDALRLRLERLGFDGIVDAKPGDTNKLADEIAGSLPKGALNVAVVDPFSLDIHYDTIAKIAEFRPLDLLILFSDCIDLVRNVERVYYPGQSDKLDLFLGADSGWRDDWDSLAHRTGPAVREMFASIYMRQLRRLGYEHARTWPLEGPRGPIFRLVFASKHELGMKFCGIALQEDFEGNRGLFGRM